MDDEKFKEQQIATKSGKNTILLIKEPKSNANSTKIL